jgi:hypothetical protein
LQVGQDDVVTLKHFAGCGGDLFAAIGQRLTWLTAMCPTKLIGSVFQASSAGLIARQAGRRPAVGRL